MEIKPSYINKLKDKFKLLKNNNTNKIDLKEHHENI
jgi:Ca2+-binding EF-hand superfamily protein